VADEIRTVAREAEQAGFDAVFSAEINSDALATANCDGGRILRPPLLSLYLRRHETMNSDCVQLSESRAGN